MISKQSEVKDERSSNLQQHKYYQSMRTINTNNQSMQTIYNYYYGIAYIGEEREIKPQNKECI